MNTEHRNERMIREEAEKKRREAASSGKSNFPKTSEHEGGRDVDSRESKTEKGKMDNNNQK